MDWKKNRKKDRQTEGQTYIQRVEWDHRGRIFASLYTIIKNKMGNIFLLVQNQYHSTWVKKSYSCLNFNLSAKKFSGKERHTEGQPDSKKDRHNNK